VINSCITILATITLLLLGSSAKAQTNWQFELFANPFAMQVGKSNFNESGLGVYSTNYSPQLGFDLGSILWRKLDIWRLNVGIGCGYRFTRSKLSYTITDPISFTEVVYLEERKLNGGSLLPSINIRKDWSQFSLLVGAEFNILVHQGENFERFESPVMFYFEVPDKTGVLQTSERIYTNNSGLQSMNLEVRPEYRITTNLKVHIAFKYGFGASQSFYELTVRGRVADMDEGTFSLNRIQINNERSFICMGLSYSFGI